MKLLLFSRIYYKFTILIADLSRIHLLFREFTMNSLSISRIKYKSKFFLANSLWFCYWITDLLWINIFSADLLWIKYHFREFNLNSLSIREYTLNLLRIYYLFGGFTTNSPSFSRINYEFTFYFPNKQWIYFLFLENAMYFLPVSRIYSEYTWYFANSLWLYHLYRKCTICPWIHYEFTMNLSPLSATITFYLLRIHYLIRESSINLLFSRKHYEFPTFYANSLWIYFVFRDSQWIHYLFRKITIN